MHTSSDKEIHSALTWSRYRAIKPASSGAALSNTLFAIEPALVSRNTGYRLPESFAMKLLMYRVMIRWWRDGGLRKFLH